MDRRTPARQEGGLCVPTHRHSIMTASCRALKGIARRAAISAVVCLRAADSLKRARAGTALGSWSCRLRHHAQLTCLA